MKLNLHTYYRYVFTGSCHLKLTNFFSACDIFLAKEYDNSKNVAQSRHHSKVYRSFSPIGY